MNFELLHPREQLVSIIDRIYQGEMTTLSGGNLSVIDEKKRIWITPGGVDKGNLKPRDIVCVDTDGSHQGLHKPSSEYPFHRAIYQKRPDLGAIVHAHPPALIAFSIAGKIPDTRVIPNVHEVCGPIGYAPYAMTGSEKLGENIAITFSGGFNIAMLENHGVVCGGENLLEAYQRMETLDFCARSLIGARRLGEPKQLSETQLGKFYEKSAGLAEFELDFHTTNERQKRQEIIAIIQRACHRLLMGATEGVISARLDEESFVITPTKTDRHSLMAEDLVLVRGKAHEKGKNPSRSVLLHQIIFAENPEINSIITSQSPYAMAFAITSVPFESRTIPESYFMLREVPMITFDTLYDRPVKIAQTLSKRAPVLIIENDSVLTTGKSVLEAYDRLEVLEYSARSLLLVSDLGVVKPIDEQRIKEIEEKFF